MSSVNLYNQKTWISDICKCIKSAILTAKELAEKLKIEPQQEFDVLNVKLVKLPAMTQ